MKRVIILFAFVLVCTAMYAQNDIQARIEFQDAEKAYSENRFSDALGHLAKAQELLGFWSHQLSYIRILSLDQLCDYRDATNLNFSTLQTEIKLYANHAAKFPDEILPAKYREVMEIESKVAEGLSYAEWIRMPEFEEGRRAMYYRDYKVAMDWFEKASGKGNEEAQRLYRETQSLKAQVEHRQAAEIEWANISGTGDMKTVAAFLEKYGNENLTLKSLAQQRYNELKKIKEIVGELVNIPGKNFLMGKFTVTFEQYDAYCEETDRQKPSDNGWSRGNRPVINVSWDDAVAFCKWISRKTGQKYRLPTTAEWKYASLGGRMYPYAGSYIIDEVAWYKKNSDNMPHPVGEKKPNGYGLYDMTGNVVEWCDDCWKNNCSRRMALGGCWYSTATECQEMDSWQVAYTTSIKSSGIGFRIVMEK